jgi:hypothetical protein
MGITQDDGFQFGLCLLALAGLGLVASLLDPPRKSELVKLVGTLERVEQRLGGRWSGSSKTNLMIRSEGRLIQVGAILRADRYSFLSVGDRIEALVAFEDMFGRDLPSLYELSVDGRIVVPYELKAEYNDNSARFLSNASRTIGVAGALLCLLRWRKYW